ncbi:MAG: DUF58 domain-containing protein [Planctomycetes bacterium]|nr:DUF58 domain-containing protein [Planctomycetota bacterium]
MPTATPYKYLDADALSRLKNLSLAARQVVEGYFAGLHKSPHKGFSIEFAEHREYTPGVDPRHIDWRVLGRRDKLYVKQYEEETSLRCYLLLDKSASMGYKSDAVALTKLQYASFLAATLAYLIAGQHDAAGLITHDTAVRDRIPPRQGAGHLRGLMEKLEQTDPGGETGLAATFHQLAESLKRRSLVVILSDLFDDPAELVGALKHFRHKKHEVIVFQVLDPAEVDFPFDDITRIEDMENRREVTSDPRAFRRAYLDELARFLETIQSGCRTAQIDYVVAQTDQRFDLFLGTYLARRQALTT